MDVPFRGDDVGHFFFPQQILNADSCPALHGVSNLKNGMKAVRAGVGSDILWRPGKPLARDYRQHDGGEYYRARREAGRRLAINDCADGKKCSGKVPCDDWTVLCFEQLETGLLYCY